MRGSGSRTRWSGRHAARAPAPPTARPGTRARYAERGARFAGTDSAWLVTLADLPLDGCDEPLPGTAALVLAADAVTGTSQGYGACVDWLTDPERCSPAAAAWLQVRAATIAPGTDVGTGSRVSAGRSRGGSRARRS